MTQFVYGRVSTTHQNVDQQTKEVLRLFPQLSVDDVVIVEEKFSGKSLDRQLFAEMRKKLVGGDQLFVLSISRLGRNSVEVLEFVNECREKQIQIFVADLGGLDITSSMGKLVTSVLSATAEMFRDELLDKQRIGIERAKSEGKYKGKQRTQSTIVKFEKAMELVEVNGLSIVQSAKLVGLSSGTVYNILKERKSQK